ncbi:MAG TPA: hypothetical protein VKA64_03205, partial [Gammaproteobacteria bacterium]|nr:hypothetical protein [Gammaproteobacteria bacterium]
MVAAILGLPVWLGGCALQEARWFPGQPITADEPTRTAASQGPRQQADETDTAHPERKTLSPAERR